MKKINIRATAVGIFLVAAIMISSGWNCRNIKVAKFVNEGDKRAYVEVNGGNKVRKIITEAEQNGKTIIVYDEQNNPEILKWAFTDREKKQNVWTIEFRADKKTRVLGRKLIEKRSLEGLKSIEPGFNLWQRNYASFPLADAGLAKDFVIVYPPDGIRPPVFDGTKIVFLTKDQVCRCSGSVTGACGNANVKCALDNLCAAWDCYVSNNWTPECEGNLNRASSCLRAAQ